MSKPSDRLVNLFGALALGVTDRIRATSAGEPALGGEAAAALVVLGHESGLSIDQLRRVLGLSHPGTVRLVDRLALAKLVTRTVAENDRRVVTLALTSLGVRQRNALLERRRASLAGILAVVTVEDRVVLERVAAAVLAALPRDACSALTVCRFCDERQCADCPMNRFGSVV
ncbi:MAG: MarR family winged helix-turn-helix transcriptional regulator [Polyangiaceae bacterium]